MLPHICVHGIPTRDYALISSDAVFLNQTFTNCDLFTVSRCILSNSTNRQIDKIIMTNDGYQNGIYFMVKSIFEMLISRYSDINGRCTTRWCPFFTLISI